MDAKAATTSAVDSRRERISVNLDVVVFAGRSGRLARPLGMRIIAHDPFIGKQVAADLGVDLVSLDDVFARADYVSLHLPSTPQTRHLVNVERLAKAKKGIRVINTARGDLVDEGALADAIEAGHVAGAAIDVFDKEPTMDQRLQMLPQVLATPHIAASTREGQELVGVETATALRDFLRDGVIRNAVNVPSVSPEDFTRLQPFLALGERLGAFLAQMSDAHGRTLSVRYYGDLTKGRNDVITNAVLVGLFRPILSASVTTVNARQVALDRGLEVEESRSTRVQTYTNLISVKLETADGERWVEGTVFERTSPRLVRLDGIEVEAPLDGTMIVIQNDDLPGVIGEVGSILGRQGVNIASFALGRHRDRAVGVVNVDAPAGVADSVMREILEVRAVREARLVLV